MSALYNLPTGRYSTSTVVRDVVYPCALMALLDWLNQRRCYVWTFCRYTICHFRDTAWQTRYLPWLIFRFSYTNDTGRLIIEQWLRKLFFKHCFSCDCSITGPRQNGKWQLCKYMFVVLICITGMSEVTWANIIYVDDRRQIKPPIGQFSASVDTSHCSSWMYLVIVFLNQPPLLSYLACTDMLSEDILSEASQRMSVSVYRHFDSWRIDERL